MKTRFIYHQLCLVRVGHLRQWQLVSGNKSLKHKRIPRCADGCCRKTWGCKNPIGPWPISRLVLSYVQFSETQRHRSNTSQRLYELDERRSNNSPNYTALQQWVDSMMIWVTEMQFANHFNIDSWLQWFNKQPKVVYECISSHDTANC